MSRLKNSTAVFRLEQSAKDMATECASFLGITLSQYIESALTYKNMQIKVEIKKKSPDNNDVLLQQMEDRAIISAHEDVWARAGSDRRLR